MMYVCPYCGTERPELRVCCGEMHSQECSIEAIEHADKVGSSPLDVQADFEAWLEKRLNEQEETE